MSPRARIADAETPANLMTKDGGQPLARIDDGNGESAELDAMAARGEAMAEFIIVTEIIDQGFEAADFGQMLFGGRHHGAEHEIERLISQKPRDQHARSEIGAVAESFESGSEALFNQASIETGDTADVGIGKRRGDGPQKIRSDAYVAIANY